MHRWPGVSDWEEAHPPRLRPALAGGLVAAAAAGLAMALLRWTLQVRTVPERTMEWALLFVPVDLFEAALQRFGFEAKRNGLLSAIALMVVVLATLGAVALYKRWATRSILVLGLGLWLFTMVVIMPLTSAGFFATALLDGTKAAILGHLAVALAYAGTLALLRAAESERLYEPATSIAGSRRSAMVLMGGAVAALGATYAAEWWGPRSRLATVVVRDPQEPFPSG